ncbi:MAG: amidohydrolase [Bacteroidetes bacterium]|nr:amidohydrolase [Bacteroidota bacterium]MBL6943015.1 amidohydrolase [Bacteroidales bacterium]
MKDIIALRHKLHSYPELSNNEFETARRITSFIQKYSPDKTLFFGKTSLVFIFNSGNAGNTLMFRAELDALPIIENNNTEYISVNKGVAHLCGHDGHMAIIAGLAARISQNRPQKGKVILLFQAAEEVEQGAKDLVENTEFQKLQPDCIFALHNIPGVEKNKILLKTGSFTAASKGMTIKLFGRTSHAGEPENGISPAMAISKIIKKLSELINNRSQFRDMTLLTIIHLQLGEIAFGTSPGYAEIRITLRSFENNDMILLTSSTERIIETICKDEKLKHEISYSEEFPATVNNSECVKLIKESAKENDLHVENIASPFRWSEDFGYYTQKYKGGFFGLGSGIDHPALHNPNYDFPDAIIETGINMYYTIYKKMNF